MVSFSYLIKNLAIFGNLILLIDFSKGEKSILKQEIVQSSVIGIRRLRSYPVFNPHTLNF